MWEGSTEDPSRVSEENERRIISGGETRERSRQVVKEALRKMRNGKTTKHDGGQRKRGRLVRGGSERERERELIKEV